MLIISFLSLGVLVILKCSTYQANFWITIVFLYQYEQAVLCYCDFLLPTY